MTRSDPRRKVFIILFKLVGVINNVYVSPKFVC